MTSDLELLDQYVRHGTQDAFTALVERHLGLETRLRTFEPILNAEQLQKYRRLKLADIEQHEDIPKLVQALRR